VFSVVINLLIAAPRFSNLARETTEHTETSP